MAPRLNWYCFLARSFVLVAISGSSACHSPSGKPLRPRLRCEVTPTQRIEPWLKRSDIRATIEGTQVDVYQDLHCRHDLLLFDDDYCWLLSLDSRTTGCVGCGHFVRSKSKLALKKRIVYGAEPDSSEEPPTCSNCPVHERVSGVGWLDACDTNPLLVFLNPGPYFERHRIRFRTCSGWAEVTATKPMW